MRFITLTVGKSQNPNTGEHWYKADAVVSVEEGENPDDVFQRAKERIDSWLPNPFNEIQVGSNKLYYEKEDKSNTSSRIQSIIQEINNCTSLDEKNKYGQQIGLLAYEQAAKDSEEVGAAYESKLQQLKNQ